jgi:anti-anti-sigma regulatory factor
MVAYCDGASRIGANGAAAMLKFAKQALKEGTTVIIANAKNSLKDIINGNVRRTILKVEA